MKDMPQGLPGSMTVKTSHSCARGEDLTPGLGAKIHTGSLARKTKTKTEAKL